jgi:hypothetical protein
MTLSKLPTSGSAPGEGVVGEMVNCQGCIERDLRSRVSFHQHGEA